MIRGITWTHIQSVWNHSGPSEVPYSTNQSLVRNFFAVSYSKPALVVMLKSKFFKTNIANISEKIELKTAAAQFIDKTSAYHYVAEVAARVTTR